jgi:hypothetical protein
LNGSDAVAPSPIGGAAEVHYSPDKDLKTTDVTLLREASKQMDMAASVLTDRAVVEALHGWPLET